jgi:uncharacterized membrane protein YoaK (UPF0700 family)
MAGSSRGRGVALSVSVALAVITGYVDAVGFARLIGVFPANQSGNLVFLGMAIGGRGPTAGWRTATAIACFAFGAAVGFLLGRRLGPRRRGPTLLGAEVVLLLAVIAISGPLHHDHVKSGFKGWMLIVLTSLAMGVQTEVIRHVAGVVVATTYESGALVRVGEVISALFFQGRDARYAKQLGVLGSVIAAYVGGAAIGATAIGGWRWPLVLPCAVLGALVVAWSVRPGWFAAIEDSTDPGQSPLP